jgi:hypothetical protein
MKKGLVTKITKYDKKDNYGNVSFLVEFANTDKGFFSTKDENQTKFVVGKDAEYNIEEKTSGAGKQYFKITLPQSENTFKPGGSGRPPIDPKVQMIGFAMSYTKDLIVAGKVEMKGLSETFDIIYNEMIGKL